MFGITSLVIRIRGCLAQNAMTDLLSQKGKQIRKAGKALALTSVGAFEGCPPNQFIPVLCLPQTQQIGYITLFTTHVTNEAPPSRSGNKIKRIDLSSFDTDTDDK
jgi:hypothetical protein